MSAKSVLVVDDGLQARDLLPGRRWSMRFASGPDEALREMERDPADVVVTDVSHGRALLTLLEAWHPTARRVVLKKPWDPAALVRAIEGSPQPD